MAVGIRLGAVGGVMAVGSNRQKGKVREKEKAKARTIPEILLRTRPLAGILRMTGVVAVAKRLTSIVGRIVFIAANLVSDYMVRVESKS